MLSMSRASQAAAVVLLAALAGPVPSAFAAGVVLAPHRAVYDMALGTSRNGSSITAVISLIGIAFAKTVADND